MKPKKLTQDDVPKLVYDGVEDDAYRPLRIVVGEQGQACLIDIKNALSRKKLPLYARKYHQKLDAFHYQAAGRVGNDCVYLQFRFEEVQPGRYQLEITRLKYFQISRVRRTVEGIIIAVLLSILPLAIIYFNAALAYGWVQRNNLLESGVQTQAVVTDSYGSAGGFKRASQYELTYEYTVENETYVSTTDVDINAYNLNDIGDSVAIVYEESNPSKNDVLYNDVLLEDAFLVGIVDVMLLIAAVVVYVKYRKGKKRADPAT